MKRAALMVMAIAGAGLLSACDEGKVSKGPDPRIDGAAPPPIQAPDLLILEKVVVVDSGSSTPATPAASAPASAPATTGVEAPATEPAVAPTPSPDAPPTDTPAAPPTDTPAPPPSPN